MCSLCSLLVNNKRLQFHHFFFAPCLFEWKKQEINQGPLYKDRSQPEFILGSASFYDDRSFVRNPDTRLHTNGALEYGGEKKGEGMRRIKVRRNAHNMLFFRAFSVRKGIGEYLIISSGTHSRNVSIRHCHLRSFRIHRSFHCESTGDLASVQGFFSFYIYLSFEWSWL